MLKEIIEELRRKQTYDLNNVSSFSLEPIPNYQLGQNWVPRFIQRYPHLRVVIEYRIESIQIDRATKEVLGEWFDIYKKLVLEKKIA